MTLQRILVTVDDSPESLKAARVAAELAGHLGARIRVLTVVEDSVVASEIERVAGPESRQRREQGAQHLAEHVRREVCEFGVPEGDVEIRTQVGNPFRRILEEARDWPADMVVMAVSDERGVRSPYVGSVTQQVLEFTSCPILVVPGREPR
ncbi:MAG: universal stress protein [Acidimicrobiales bacterium]|jgi:nucleotide-binding universal stress UspA family protein